MLKRLIEVALPLKEVSEQSAREKSIRHGHISTLHIWWARRPLAACRAVVFASLIPDPDDPECPASFRTLVNDLLPAPPNHRQDAGATPDTPRNRCLEFIKHLVKWENSNNGDLIGKARKLIAAAHKFLHPGAEGDRPKVLDPFAGGGAIPLEALRLGCEAHAIELNPVAHLIELCTLVYPQKYGQPNSRPTPDYIKKLEAARQGKDGDGLFSKKDGKSKASGAAEIDGIALTRLPLISEAEYQKNPLAADVKFWGHWVLEKARDEIGQFYPPDPDGSIPVAYLWARTVKCPNPACGATIPMLMQSWLCKKPHRKIALRLTPNEQARRCDFEIVRDAEVDFDADAGTVQRGNATCPFCHQVCAAAHTKAEGNAGRLGQQMTTVVTTSRTRSGKQYRAATEADEATYRSAQDALRTVDGDGESDAVPQEPTSDHIVGGGGNCQRYGKTRFGDLFNDRQKLCLATLVRQTVKVFPIVRGIHGAEYGRAVSTLLATTLDWFADKSSSIARWHNSGEKLSGTYSRQALPMVWDYAEVSPISGAGSDYLSGLAWTPDLLTRGVPKMTPSGANPQRSVCGNAGITVIAPVSPENLRQLFLHPNDDRGA